MNGPRQRDEDGRTGTARRNKVPGASAPVIPQPFSRKGSLVLKLTVIARHFWQRFDQRVEREGVSRAKWSLIAAVARNPGATQRAIAAMLEVREVTAGQMIDRLCADGYLERRENPKDRRAYCVYLTPVAQPVLQQLGEVAKIHEDEAFAGLDDEDLSRLDALLDVMARNLAASRNRDEAKKSRGPRAGVDE
jgi:MarR family transcriptional regulator for hemolysin